MTTRPSTPHDHVNASVTHLIAIQYVLAIRTPTGNTAPLETGVLSECGASEIIGCITTNQQYNSMYVQCTCLLDMTVTFHSYLHLAVGMSSGGLPCRYLSSAGILLAPV